MPQSLTLVQSSSKEFSSSWAQPTFFSKKLSVLETHYSAFDHELLDAYYAIPSCWYSCGWSSWFLLWRFSFSSSLCQLLNPCSGFNFSSSLLQCFFDSVNWLFPSCSAPETVFRNLGSNFKLFAQHATSSFLWSVSSLWSLYRFSKTSSSWFSLEILVSPNPWSVSPWSLSFLQVNLSTFWLEKFVQRCWPLASFLHYLPEKQDPDPHPFQCSTIPCSQ